MLGGMAGDAGGLGWVVEEDVCLDAPAGESADEAEATDSVEVEGTGAQVGPAAGLDEATPWDLRLA